MELKEFGNLDWNLSFCELRQRRQRRCRRQQRCNRTMAVEDVSAGVVVVGDGKQVFVTRNIVLLQGFVNFHCIILLLPSSNRSVCVVGKRKAKRKCIFDQLLTISMPYLQLLISSLSFFNNTQPTQSTLPSSDSTLPPLSTYVLSAVHGPLFLTNNSRYLLSTD